MKILEHTHCDVCGSRVPQTVLNLGSFPLSDDLRPEAEAFPTEILFCDMCGTASQKYRLANEDIFRPDYHYRAGMTQDVLRGMDQFVGSAARHVALAGARVLDIGCNDGSLLDAFSARGAKTFGVTPENAASDAERKGHTILQDYFDTPSAESIVDEWDGPFDLITFTNVFAHIDPFDDLLDAVKVCCHDHTIIGIENHYLGSVLERDQFDTFYHEHPRTYSYTSFVHVADRLGMHIVGVEFPARYGGNIRVFMGPGRAEGEGQIIHAERGFESALRRMAGRVERWKNKKGLLIREHAPLAACAFPARATLLIPMLGLTHKEIPSVFEKEGSDKIGHYIPGTHITIANEMGLLPENYKKPLLNLAWHIPDEIEARWRSRGFENQMINVVDPEDFT